MSNITINTLMAYTSKDFTLENIRETYSHNFDDYMTFFKENKNEIYKRHNGLLGCWNEQIVKDGLIIENHGLYVVDHETDKKKRINFFMSSSSKGAVDFLYETKECLYVGSGKTHYGKKNSMSLAGSGLTHELWISNKTIARAKAEGKKIVVIISADQYIDIKEIKKNVIPYVDKVIIYCLTDGCAQSFMDRGGDLLRKMMYEKKMDIVSVRSVFNRNREALENYQYNIDKFFSNMYADEPTKPFALYHSQKQMCKDIMDAYLDGSMVVCLVAPTRSGKATMAADTMKNVTLHFNGSLAGKVFVFESFKPDSFGNIEEDIKRVFDGKVQIIKPTVDKNWKIDPTLPNVFILSGQFSVSYNEIKDDARRIMEMCDFLVFDEAHIGYGSTRQQMFRALMDKGCRTLVTTATPYTHDLVGMKTITFTDIDRIMSVINGYPDYKNHPILLSMNFDLMEVDKKRKFPWSSILEMVNVPKNIQTFFNEIMISCSIGVDVEVAKKSILSSSFVTNPTYLSNCPPLMNPHHFFVICGNREILKKAVSAVVGMKNPKNGMKIEVNFSTSEENGDYDNTDVVTRINEFFGTWNGERYVGKWDDTFRFFFVVKQATCGTTLHNIEGVIMLTDTVDFTSYEQGCGRCLQPVEKNGEYLPFTFVIDPLTNRSLQMSYEKIDYVVQHNKSYSETEIRNWYIFNTRLNIVCQRVEKIDVKSFEKKFFYETLKKELSLESSFRESFKMRFRSENGNFIPFTFDERYINEEILKKISSYMKKHEKGALKIVKAIKDNFFESEKVTYGENVVEDEKKKWNTEEVFAIILQFVIHTLMKFFFVKYKSLHQLTSFNGTDEDFYDFLSSMMDEVINGDTYFKQFFDSDVLNIADIANFQDLLEKIFYSKTDENRRFLNLNKFRVKIVDIANVIAHNSRMETLYLIMASNQVRDFGEVFTPIDFIENKIIPRIYATKGAKWFENIHLKIADIACGSGNFLVVIFPHLFKAQRKYFSSDEECERWIVENELYGRDIQRCNVITTQVAVDKNNLIPNNPHFSCGDTLSKDFDWWGVERFDLIIGNPPYQKSVEGRDDNSSKNIYYDFVYAAKKKSDFVIQIIMSKWFEDEGNDCIKFRENMLNSSLVELHDYFDSWKVFPKFTRLHSGCCWFIWDKNYDGNTKVFTYVNDEVVEREVDMNRETFYRHPKMKSIIAKVASKSKYWMDECVSSMDPFLLKKNNRDMGLPDNRKFRDVRAEKSEEYSQPIYYVAKQGSRISIQYTKPEYVKSNEEYVNCHKLFFGKAGGPVDKEKDNRVSSPMKIAKSGELVACSMCIILKKFENMTELLNCKKYIDSRFVRFLHAMGKPSINDTKRTWKYVPDVIDYSDEWTDKRIYEYFELSKDEVEAIESFVIPFTKDDE